MALPVKADFTLADAVVPPGGPVNLVPPYTARTARIINNYADASLGEWRQLRVWDEHPRRRTDNPLMMHLTYQNLNGNFVPEVWDAQNNRVDPIRVTVDYPRGYIQIDGDTGNDDYFVTYDFDYFPGGLCFAWLNLTLNEINASVDSNGGFLTQYTTIDQAPEFWDAPLTLGLLVKAWRRLFTDSWLWKNRLIWADGSTGPQMALEAANAYLSMYDELRKSVKRQHLLAKPTHSFELFETIGFGFFAVGGSKFRELRLNRLSTF